MADEGIRSLFAAAWCAETSADPDGWRAENPAWGQCAVTALAVQAMCGGELMRGAVNEIAHYWNRLPNGELVDLTFQQFGQDAVYNIGVVVREREYVLSFPDTARRYALLLERMR